MGVGQEAIITSHTTVCFPQDLLRRLKRIFKSLAEGDFIEIQRDSSLNLKTSGENKAEELCRKVKQFTWLGAC